jgi:hypothetical protein
MNDDQAGAATPTATEEKTPQPLGSNEAAPVERRASAVKKSSAKKNAAKKAPPKAARPPSALDDVEGSRVRAQKQLEASQKSYTPEGGPDFSGVKDLVDEDVEAGRTAPPVSRTTPQRGQWQQAESSPPPRPSRGQASATRTIPQNVPRAAVSGGPAATNIGKVLDDGRSKLRDRPQHSPPTGDALNDRLGVRGCAERQRFPWALDRRGHHLEFSRYYRALRLLVDRFPKPSSIVDDEVAQKYEAICAYNVEHPKEPLGYIGLYLGEMPTDNTLGAALEGEFFAPPVRMPIGQRETAGAAV